MLPPDAHTLASCIIWLTLLGPDSLRGPVWISWALQPEVDAYRLGMNTVWRCTHATGSAIVCNGQHCKTCRLSRSL